MPAEAPMLELIDHGINQAKFFFNAIVFLLTELKEQSTVRRVKTMVDGFNP